MEDHLLASVKISCVKQTPQKASHTTLPSCHCKRVSNPPTVCTTPSDRIFPSTCALPPGGLARTPPIASSLASPPAVSRLLIFLVLPFLWPIYHFLYSRKRLEFWSRKYLSASSTWTESSLQEWLKAAEQDPRESTRLLSLPEAGRKSLPGSNRYSRWASQNQPLAVISVKEIKITVIQMRIWRWGGREKLLRKICLRRERGTSMEEKGTVLLSQRTAHPTWSQVFSLPIPIPHSECVHN